MTNLATNCYDFLLDLYPIMTAFPPEAALLTMRMEQVAFDLIQGGDEYASRNISSLRVVLRLAKDLGYLEERLFFFLERRAALLE